MSKMTEVLSLPLLLFPARIEQHVQQILQMGNRLIQKLPEAIRIDANHSKNVIQSIFRLV
jgi:hypothetical protein